MSETRPRTALAIEWETLGEREDSMDRLADLTSEAVDRARPLEFDRNGFPVVQRPPDFDTRVARLLGS